MKKVNEKGFTLAELLIVVAIIAVLVAVAIPTFGNQIEKAREATDIANLRAAYAQVVTDSMEDPTVGTTATIELKQTQAGWQTTPVEIAGKNIENGDAPTANGELTVVYTPAVDANTPANIKIANVEIPASVATKPTVTKLNATWDGTETAVEVTDLGLGALKASTTATVDPAVSGVAVSEDGTKFTLTIANLADKANLVVADDKIVINVTVKYTPSGKTETTQAFAITLTRTA